MDVERKRIPRARCFFPELGTPRNDSKGKKFPYWLDSAGSDSTMEKKNVDGKKCFAPSSCNLRDLNIAGELVRRKSKMRCSWIDRSTRFRRGRIPGKVVRVTFNALPFEIRNVLGLSLRSLSLRYFIQL